MEKPQVYLSEKESALVPEIAPIVQVAATDVVFPPIRDVKRDATLEELQEEDLTLANGAVRAVYASWAHVKSISGVCKLVDATFKAIENRRKVLLQPYGVQSSAKDDKPVIPL